MLLKYLTKVDQLLESEAHWLRGCAARDIKDVAVDPIDPLAVKFSLGGAVRRAIGMSCLQMGQVYKWQEGRLLIPSEDVIAIEQVRLAVLGAIRAAARVSDRIAMDRWNDEGSFQLVKTSVQKAMKHGLHTVRSMP